MDGRSLQDFYANHEGNATDKWALYLSTYDRLFRPYRDQPIRLLEIGIQNGGSLEIWSQYFQAGERFVGCDIDPACARLVYADPRISVIVGDANEPATRDAVLACSNCYDIVLDDGSHRSGDIVNAFVNYFPSVALDGMFVAEDLHCSYWQEFEGGLFDPFSSMSFFKHLADILNHESWGVQKARTDLVAGICAKYGCSIEEATLAQVHSVEFVNSICIVRKKPAPRNLLGTRFVAGTMELVAPGNLSLHGLPRDDRPDQSRNPWSARTVPPAEVVVQLEADLDQAKAKVASLDRLLTRREAELAVHEAERLRMLADFGAEVAELVRTVETLHASSSWRLTAPGRWAKHSFRRALAGLGLLAVAKRRTGGVTSLARTAVRVLAAEGPAGIGERLRCLAQEEATEARPAQRQAPDKQDTPR